MKIGLVLEGGAARGVFTAGVLDFFMEQGISFSYVAGVSAGACNAMDYISGQIGRTRDCMIHGDKGYDYCGAKVLLRKKCLFDLDMTFDDFPNRHFPFDYEAYFANPIEREYVATDCLTGKPAYLTDRQGEREYLMQIGRASSALPGAVPVVMLEGKPYADGGISDSIPVRRAFEQGCDRVVVIQTRRKEFRMRHPKTEGVIARMYRRYPALGRQLHQRPLEYNKTLAYIRRMEGEGKVLSIRPELPEVKRMERGYKPLMDFYYHGYCQGERYLETVKGFLAGK